MNLVESIRTAGVVGCGGAGFPSQVKAASKADIVVANGAECEPLLHKDLELMMREPEAIVGGVKLLMSATGAQQGIIGVKKKYEEKLDGIKLALRGTNITVQFLGDYYPTGDEYVLVYETTKRLIPPQGIPLDVGVVVHNVETLRNLHRADQDLPSITKYISVAGAVAHPSTFEVPIGISFADVLKAAGGVTVPDYAVFVSGIMMGKLETDMTLPITKTCAGLIVLPTTHRLVQRKSLPADAMHRIGKSACDQCSFCTEFCPRYLLGYDVQPHKVMRSLSFTATGEDIWNQSAQLCCACGLCTLYACPEDLYPKEACDKAKSDLRTKGIKWSGDRDVHIHPIYDGRHVPLKKLVAKLGIEEYDVLAHFVEKKFSPDQIRLPLLQHLGAPAKAIVSIGQRVNAGEAVADIPEGKLGARIHASIDGQVKTVDGEIVIERA
ncbi:MAG: 4Fe-4S dicluster domain-containing protein [Ignavibacteriales bacterium]|nr:4Fe-4S dicluster domain-containing protein [Ignavibacteriales bacterium]